MRGLWRRGSEMEMKSRFVQLYIDISTWIIVAILEFGVTPRFPKYAEIESRRESTTYIREENTTRIHAKPKIT